MDAGRIAITIDGEQARDLYEDLSWVEVDTGDDLAALFRFELALPPRPDGSWTHLDDERLSPWRKVGIEVGFDDGLEPVMTGYITHVLPTFEADAKRCRLQVWGMDATVLMDREERLRTWPDKADSDIAWDVISGHALTPQVEDTTVVHDAAVSTVVQRETDAQLLRRLALRNGFECFVEDTTVHFRAPGSDTVPQPPLAVHFGDQTTVLSLSLEVHAVGPGEIAAFQLDRSGKDVLSSLAGTSRVTPMGANTAADLRTPGMAPARSVLAASPTTGALELERLCQALHETGEWFVLGEGVVDGHRYGTVLRPRAPVTIKGIGDTYSGVYDVIAVTHTIDAGGYRQHVRVRRNGLGLTGMERFDAPTAGR